MKAPTILLLLVLPFCLLAKDKDKPKMISPSTAELLAYWNFEQDPVLVPPIWDQTHNGNHLIPNSNFVVGVPGLTDGRVGNGLLLNGANQTLFISAGSHNVSHQGEPFEAFLWYKPVALVDDVALVTSTEWSIALLGSSVSATIDGKALLLTDAITAGEWNLIRVGWTGDRIFVNVNFTSGKSIYTPRSSVSSVNGVFIVGGNGSNGIFDEFGIYRRYLSIQEAGAIWNDGNGLAFSEYEKPSCAKKITCCDP